MIVYAYLIRQALERLKRAPVYEPERRLSPVEIFPDRWKGGRTRRLDEIDRVILHQTGVEFGVTARQVKEAGGDEREAHRRRFRKVPYHFVVTRFGELLWVHPLNRWTYHAGPVNRHTIGVAVEGRWDSRHKTQIDMVLTGVLLGVANAQIREGLGREVPWSTHRQCSANRPIDPGHVVVQAAMRGGARLDLRWTTNGGRPAMIWALGGDPWAT